MEGRMGGREEGKEEEKERKKERKGKDKIVETKALPLCTSTQRVGFLTGKGIHFH